MVAGEKVGQKCVSSATALAVNTRPISGAGTRRVNAGNAFGNANSSANMTAATAKSGSDAEARAFHSARSFSR